MSARLPAAPVSPRLPRISAIVLCYNGRDLLETCLTSLLAQEPRPEILVIDNGSADGSPAFVREHFAEARVIENGRNLGFAEGNNVGLRAASGELLLVVNADTEAAPGALSALAAPLLADTGVGAAAPKMLQFYARDRMDAAGLTVDRAGIGWNLDRGAQDPHEKASREVFGASGGAALYRKAMLDEVGLFDADYFAYYEDIDLAWRMRLAGWKCVHVPTAEIYHIHGASFSKVPARRLFLLARNKWWTILKDYPWPPLLLYAPWILFADAASLLYSLLVRRELHSLRGRIAALRGLKNILSKRRVIQQQRRASWRELARWMK